MLHLSRIAWLAVFALASALPVLAQTDATPPVAEAVPKFAAEDLAFFEQKIRPVLEKHCVECHSVKAAAGNKLKGGLLVDSRNGLLTGGDSGPAIVPSQAEKSLLLEALRYESVQMPPQGKLPANVIADFDRWIARGAADPRVGNAAVKSAKGLDIEQGRRHWSYQPLRDPKTPEITGLAAKPQTAIDAFVLSKIPVEGLAGAGVAAERTTLVRRIYFDLIGIPPEPEQAGEFLADDSPDALERLVDRLMTSPHFGARWGRHWLSVVRFGESLTLRGFVLPEAWRYRDYVVDSFNADLPFDQFVIEQIAGDLLPSGGLADRQRQLIATTFLTLGNYNLEEQDKKQLEMDVVDEQLDVIGKGFLAQTIGCARCHDHKFDPIPTRDYYALAGILANVKTLEHANVSKWLELPIPLEPDRDAELAAHETAIAAIQAKIDGVKADQQKLQKSAAKTVVAAKELPGVIVDDRQAKVVGEWQSSQSVKPYVDEGYLHDKNDGKGDKTITLLPELPKAGMYEVRLAYTPGETRCDAVPVTVFSADGEKTIMVNQKLNPPIDGLFISLGQYRFEMNGQGFVIVATAGTKGHVIVDAAQFLPVDANGAVVQTSKPTVTAESSKADQDEVAKLGSQLKSLQKDLKDAQAACPRRPRYMSVQEGQKIGDIKVHIRGTVHNLGDTVPRGFLQVAMKNSPTPLPSSQSGRKELGEWIASRDNPLTPRVTSNRVWYWLFGAGLSRTPDNFGTTGEPPTHPELLDRLSVRLLERNWSLKGLIREIVQSGTYAQSSAVTVAQTAADPDNRLLGHQNRRRLEAECLLDAILTVSGQRCDELGGNTIAGGKAEDYGYVHRSNRRAVYWPVLRNSLPEIFEVFDFSDPSLPSGTRNASTVASQSLYFMNDEWVTAEARQTATRVLVESHPDDTARVERVFRLVLGRAPGEQEGRIARGMISSRRSAEDSWTMLVQALFASIDFRYVE